MKRINEHGTTFGFGHQAAFAMLFLMVTYVFNLGLHGHAHISHTLAVGGSQIALFYGYCYLIRRSFKRTDKRFSRTLLIGLSVIVPLLAPLLIYQVFPLLGVQLQRSEATFRTGEFLAKVFMALKTVWLGAGIYYYFYAKSIAEKQVLELERKATDSEKKGLQFKNKLLVHTSKSHYARHGMNDLIARAVKIGDAYLVDGLTHLFETKDYVADATAADKPVVSIHRALPHLYSVAESIRRRRGGPQVLVLEVQGEPTMQVIGPLTLTTLLENADTHGMVSAEHPIRARIVLSPGLLIFTCRNAKPQGGSQVKSTGQGLELVKEELELLNGHDVRLDIEEDEISYTISLTINYT